jgi:hypothetical protein
MVRLFVRHTVSDYATWRKHYDAFDTERSGMGVTAQAVYCATDNPNDVTITHDFETAEAAQAFVAAPRLREVMTAAGVASEPTVWFTSPA